VTYLPSEDLFAAAWDINNKGEVVGTVASAVGQTAAVIWRNGLPVKLGAEMTHAKEINDRGEIAGNGSPVGGGWPRGYLWKKGVITELPTLPGGPDNFTEVSAMNDRGDIVGKNSTFEETHAVRWRGGKVTDLGKGEAYGVNSRGEIVGRSFESSSPRATLWR
jgi:uncharacterized membrane protein